MLLDTSLLYKTQLIFCVPAPSKFFFKKKLFKNGMILISNRIIKYIDINLTKHLTHLYTQN